VSNSGIADGLLHAHTAAGGEAASDLTGMLALVAGAVPVALAIPLLHLGEETATRRRRWAYRAAALIAGAFFVYASIYPVTKIVGTHEHRTPIGDSPGASKGPASFSTRQPVSTGGIGSGPVRTRGAL
jgi:hypothetical protein